MAIYVITSACADVKDKACVEACPVDCIHGDDEDRILYINPTECIECGACEPVCPTNAIFSLDDLPSDKSDWVEINNLWYEDKEAARNKVKDILG